MASEIRVNKIINRSGLSTVTFSDTGAIVSGIVTANSFSGNVTGNVTGSGANLTSIPAGQLTGTVADARLTSVTASKLSGALPALDGSALTGINTAFGSGTSVNTSGIITATAFVPTTQGPLSHRNVWMNGNFGVAQRGTQQTSVTSLSGYATGGPDRCYINITNHGTWTVKQGTDGPPGFKSCMEMIATTGDSSVASNASVRWWQRFEGQDLQRFMKGTSSAKQFALSFYIKSSTTGTYAFELLDYDSGNRHMVKTYTVDSADTWEYKTIIFPGDTTGPFANDANSSLAAEFWLVAGTDWTSGGTITNWATTVNNKRAGGHTANAGASDNDYVRITGVQLEVGPVSTPYEQRSFAEELRRCQRYFERIHIDGTDVFLVGNNQFNSVTYHYIPFLVEKRVIPTVSLDATGFHNYACGTGSNGTGNLTAGTFSKSKMHITTGGLGANTIHFVYKTADGYADASAEL